MTTRIDWRPAKKIREHRAGTKRAKVIAMLSRKNGATRAQLMRATGWDEKDLRDGLRLVNVAVGYGVREDTKGRLRLVQR